MFGALTGLAWVAGMAIASSQTGETFSGTATITTAGGASATAPITVTVERTMSREEAEALVGAFTQGGVAGLRKALVGVPPTGSIKLGGGEPTSTRLTFERPTDNGRLITIVSDTPLLFLGAGVPEGKPKEGYDFAVLDLLVGGNGDGSGMLAPAARITVKQGVFVIDDYASDAVRLTSVKAIK
jgi:hypothetical protein